MIMLSYLDIAFPHPIMHTRSFGLWWIRELLVIFTMKCGGYELHFANIIWSIGGQLTLTVAVN